MLFAACKQRSYLGGQAIDASPCATSCMSMDAGVDASEVGPPARPDSRLPGEPADAATVAAFTASLEGLWHGVSRRLGMNESQISSRFELTFVANARGDGGRFDLRCLDDEVCAPFGAPGPGPEGGSYTIINLGERARASSNRASR